MTLKLGRKPAVRNERTKRLSLAMDKALAPLGAPPIVSKDYITAVHKINNGNWGMMGNDIFGDCVQADDSHYLLLRTANVGNPVIPTTADTLHLYTEETGFNPNIPNTDQGTDEVSDCIFMCQHGLLGHKADATGVIESNNQKYLKWCIQLFGGCKFGVNLPSSAMDQFDAGQPWTVVANDGGIRGGHDVLGVHYDTTSFYAVTWGKLQAVSPEWIAKYCDEAHALLFADWIEKNGSSPSGFNLQKLLADLREISSPQASVRRQHRHHRRVKRRTLV